MVILPCRAYAGREIEECAERRDNRYWKCDEWADDWYYKCPRSLSENSPISSKIFG